MTRTSINILMRRHTSLRRWNQETTFFRIRKEIEYNYSVLGRNSGRATYRLLLLVFSSLVLSPYQRFGKTSLGSLSREVPLLVPIERRRVAALPTDKSVHWIPISRFGLCLSIFFITSIDGAAIVKTAGNLFNTLCDYSDFRRMILLRE